MRIVEADIRVAGAFRRSSSSPGPLGMTSKQAINQADLVGEHEAEEEAEQTRSHSQPTRKQIVTSDKPERGGDAHCDQHHACNGAYPKDQ